MESVDEDDAIVDEQRKKGESEKKRKESEEIHWGIENLMEREGREEAAPVAEFGVERRTMRSLNAYL